MADDTKPRVGQFRLRNGNPCKCMAVVDNWVMARYPGCVPFTMWWKDWVSLPLAERPGRSRKA